MSQAGVLSSSGGPGPSGFVYTPVSMDTTATDQDQYLSVDTSTLAITITLPASPTQYRRYIIKDRTGNATNKNITIDGNGKTIDGSATQLINSDYGSSQLLYNGTSWELF